jgi:opine dehydrogenase
MSPEAVVVLGAGNTGLSIAAKLALEGHRVTLWEAPSQAAAIAPIAERRQVRLTGVGGEGTATLAAVTTDAAEALAAADVMLAAVPSYAHAAFADLLAPSLEPRHVLALLPGNLGTLAFARRLRELAPRAQPPLLVEADTAPYVCRKLAPDHAHIWGVVPHLGAGTLPAAQTDRALAALAPLFPGLRTYAHVVAAGIGALNPVVHPPGVLMNAGRIEYARGDFYFYEEGVTPAVVRAIEALDAERRAIGLALGFEVTPVAQAFAEAGFGPHGDLWATINGSRMLTQLRAPGSLQTRWLSEDVPYGVRTWVELGEQFGVALPVGRALVTLGDAVMGSDSWRDGRSLADLGIAGVGRDPLLAYLLGGRSETVPA